MGNQHLKYRGVKLRNSSDRTRTQVELHERRQVAMSLRMAGASYADIVRANIGYKNTGHVSQDIKKILAAFQYETPEDVLVLDLARLDEMQKLITAAFRTGDLSQASMLLRIMQFRRETLGITAEVIAGKREESKALVNNGIMVVQGSSADYIRSMAEAAGASPEEVRKELEKISGGPREIAQKQSSQVIDGEVTEPLGGPPLTDQPAENFSDTAETVYEDRSENTKYSVRSPDFETFEDSFENFSERAEINERQKEELPSLQLDSPILSIDFPDDDSQKVSRKRKLLIRTKKPDNNIERPYETPYRRAPRKPTESEGEQQVRRKLKRSSKSPDLGKRNPRLVGGTERLDGTEDELETETFIEEF